MSYGGIRHPKVQLSSFSTAKGSSARGGSGAAVAGSKSACASGGGKSERLKFEEIRGDLFSCPSSSSLAHCVSEDLAMGRGIATVFKREFGGIDQLRKQGVKPGGVAVLERGERCIFYMVTKTRYFHKPTYNNLQASLNSLREQCSRRGIRQLCMPRIGCGLDKLEWGRVKLMIRDTFSDLDISVTIYSL